MSHVQHPPPDTNVHKTHTNTEEEPTYVICLDTSLSVNIVWVSKDASAHFQTGRSLELRAPSGKLAPH